MGLQHPNANEFISHQRNLRWEHGPENFFPVHGQNTAPHYMPTPNGAPYSPPNSPGYFPPYNPDHILPQYPPHYPPSPPPPCSPSCTAAAYNPAPRPSAPFRGNPVYFGTTPGYIYNGCWYNSGIPRAVARDPPQQQPIYMIANPLQMPQQNPPSLPIQVAYSEMPAPPAPTQSHPVVAQPLVVEIMLPALIPVTRTGNQIIIDLRQPHVSGPVPVKRNPVEESMAQLFKIVQGRVRRNQFPRHHQRLRHRLGHRIIPKNRTAKAAGKKLQPEQVQQPVDMILVPNSIPNPENSSANEAPELIQIQKHQSSAQSGNVAENQAVNDSINVPDQKEVVQMTNMQEEQSLNFNFVQQECPEFLDTAITQNNTSEVEHQLDLKQEATPLMNQSSEIKSDQPSTSAALPNSIEQPQTEQMHHIDPLPFEVSTADPTILSEITTPVGEPIEKLEIPASHAEHIPDSQITQPIVIVPVVEKISQSINTTTAAILGSNNQPEITAPIPEPIPEPIPVPIPVPIPEAIPIKKLNISASKSTKVFKSTDSVKNY
ncbi:inverted formin-2-like [Drosophila gunungcola]|uniref:inverted formin-2-like n=1 Tax=Drosophila gunungcola TaxID=103775 RepID=UPI0022E447E4|nr:inverted formin-2-like [Drosophila gunungcola]XP_052858011.1 inverted formin-2-like [Drosophila gunungcola]XP_052858012.1 inverted formin-2-like [Drosophila gunungcola]